MNMPTRTHRHDHSLGYQDAPSGPRPPCVLIITEGRVTEKEYFRLLAEELGLNRHRVTIVSSKGTSPMNVLEQAQKRLEKGEKYEYVYCVFDKDVHDSYEKAVNLIKNMSRGIRRGTKIEAITSIPCFEYWMYLHVSDSTTSYSGVESPCESLTRELKRHPPFKNYQKSKDWMSSNFKAIANNRDKAVKRSKKIIENARKAGVEEHLADPSTRVHVVIEDLDRIKPIERS